MSVEWNGVTYPSGLSSSETIGSLLTLTACLLVVISSAAVELEGECIDSLAESEKYEVWESRRLTFALIINCYLESCPIILVCIYVELLISLKKMCSEIIDGLYHILELTYHFNNLNL